MLGCKNYSRVELDHCKAAVEQQLASYKTLVKAVADGGAGEVGTALEAFEVQSINNMTFVLDRYFVHRLRMSPARTATRSTKSRC